MFVLCSAILFLERVLLLGSSELTIDPQCRLLLTRRPFEQRHHSEYAETARFFVEVRIADDSAACK